MYSVGFIVGKEKACPPPPPKKKKKKTKKKENITHTGHLKTKVKKYPT